MLSRQLSFKEVGFIERYGSGILRVRQICRDYGIIEPKFEEVFDGFRVTLFKEKVSSGELNGELDTEEVRKKYGRNAEEILKIIVKNPESTTQIMAEQINVSISTIEKNIAKLKKAGIIERVGSTKSGYWKIVSSDKQQ